MARAPRFTVRRPVLWVSIAAVVALVVGAVVAWRLSARDDRSGSPAVEIVPPPAGMVVDLQRLGGGKGAVPVGATVPLVVSAAGQAPLAAIELWAGEVQVDRVALEGTDTADRVAFDWAATPGDIVLTARSIDSVGRSALSNPVRVRVVDAAITEMGSVIEHQVQPGDTLTTIAATYGSPAEAIAIANPGAFGDDLAPIVATLSIPVAITADQVAEGAGETSGLFASAKPPSSSARGESANIVPPPVGVELDGCTAVVSSPSATTATGFAAYVLPPDGEMFTLVASAPIGDTLQVPLPSGVSSLVVSSFDQQAQSYGPVSTLQTGDDCTNGWTGELRLEASRLITATDAESAYLYLSDGDGWQRVPATGSVPRTGGGFDFTGLLPDTGSGEIDIEAWGRKGGEIAFLGAGHKAASDQQVPVVPKVVRTQLWWIESPATATAPEKLSLQGFVPDPGVLSFRWKASTPLVTKGVWQVTSYLPPATAGIDLPGVIAQDSVSGSEGVFTINFATFTGKQVPTASASASLPLMATLGGIVQVPTGSPKLSGPVVAVGADGPTATKDGATVALGNPTKLPSPPEPTRFYVRFVPFIGEQFTGRASREVVIDTKINIDPSIWEGGPIGQPGSNVYELSLTVTPPSTPDPWMARCWEITEIDPLKFDLKQYGSLYTWFMYLQKTQYGGTICPICYVSGGGSIDFAGYYGYKCATDDDSFNPLDPSTYDNFPLLGPLISGIVKAGISIWDLAVQLATYLKAQVVNLVSKIGCESFVNAGSAAAGENPPADAQKWCNTVAEIAVDAVLISAGIPPTLPNFEQAMQAAKGDLVDLIVQQASAMGIPCDEAELVGQSIGDDTLTCTGLASAAVDGIIEQVKVAVTASAGAVSGMFFPPGVYAVPHPNGLVQPPEVKITVTPTAQAPFSGITCPATVVMTSTYLAIPTFPADGLVKMPDLNYGYSKNLGLHNGLWLTAQAFGGFVIQPMTIQLPALPVAGGGLSPATKHYVLNQLTPHDELSAWTYGSGVLPQPSSSNTIQRQVKIPYASMQLHPGATLITSVHSSCASDVTVIGTILPNRQLQVTKVTP